jgi:hypothetical protein
MLKMHCVADSSLAMKLQGPSVVMAIHIGIPHIINTDAGSTPLGIVAFHTSNSMRLLDPIADVVLSVKVVLAAGKGDCPFGATTIAANTTWLAGS